MAPEKQIFDPDGDLILILPSAPSSTTTSSSSVPGGSALKHKEPAKEVHIHVQVSSKHMMLASPVFKAMLTHSFQEGNALREAGHVEIPLPDDNSVVFTMLLDIIHGRGRRVPRVVPLRMLAMLAAAVDKYQLQEPVAVFSDTWLKESVVEVKPQEEKELFVWLSISWVFQDAGKFRKVTGILIREGKGDDFGHLCRELSIPQKVLGNLDAIRTQRREIIKSLYENVESLIARYTKSSYRKSSIDICSCTTRRDLPNTGCDAMVLGYLIKGCSDTALWPAPQPPYLGVSISQFVQIVGKFQVKGLCRLTSHDVMGFTKSAEEIEERLACVNLKFFSPLMSRKSLFSKY